MRRVLLTTIVLLSLTGCGDELEATRVAEAPSVNAPFDPCGIPESVIAAAGLNPATASSMSERGYVLPDWSVCTWANAGQPSWYFVTVSHSQKYTLDDVRADGRYSDMREITIGGENVLQYKFDAADSADICDVAYQTTNGLVKISARKKASADLAGDLCEEVREQVQALASSLQPS